LALLKLKAEFEAHNAGAKGFCLRLGFQREALFKADVKLDGHLRDVAIYSLTAHRYHSVLLPRLLNGLSAPPLQPKRQPLFS
jgi:RimJ/RimL family protein N-acetyltransferase